MIIYGKRFKAVSGYEIEAPCPQCDSHGLTVNLFRGYVHIFWIPFLPFGRRALLHCEHCQWTEDSGDLAKSIEVKCLDDQKAKDDFKSLAKRASTPWYLWVGLVLCLVVGGTGYVMENRNQQALTEWIANPQEDSLIIIKFLSPEDADYPYQILYVIGVNGDYGHVLLGNHSYSQVGGAHAAISKYTKAILDDKAGDVFGSDKFEVNLKKFIAENKLVETHLLQKGSKVVELKK